MARILFPYFCAIVEGNDLLINYHVGSAGPAGADKYLAAKIGVLQITDNLAECRGAYAACLIMKFPSFAYTVPK